MTGVSGALPTGGRPEARPAATAPPAPSPAPAPDGPRHLLEHHLATVLTAGTLAGMAFVAAGVVSMLVSGMRPLAGGAPDPDPARIAADLAALRPAGFLWLGLVAIVATPSARVAGAMLGFAGQGDRRMAAVAAAVLIVVAAGAGAGWVGG